MKIKIGLITFISFCTIISSAYSGDTSSYDLIGFSKDGKYIAFERYGNQDGSGFPYSEIFFVDVLKNSYVSKPFKTIIEDGDAENAVQARKKNKEKASSKFATLNIVKGNRGRKVYQKGQQQPVSEISFDLIGNKYRIILKEFESDKMCDFGYKAKIFELKLIVNNKIQILQKDNQPPVSRGCPFSYHIENVFINGNKIAVILDYGTPGFEGPNHRQIVITGGIHIGISKKINKNLTNERSKK